MNSIERQVSHVESWRGEGRGAAFLRFDLHQTLTEPGDTLPKMFIFV